MKGFVGLLIDWPFVVFIVCVISTIKSQTIAGFTATQSSSNPMVPTSSSFRISWYHHQNKYLVRRNDVPVVPMIPTTTATTRTRTVSSSTTQLSVSLFNPTVMVASISATIKLLSSIGLGTLYTPLGPKLFGNILDSSAISILSKLTFWIFQPCFLFAGVAGTLSTAMTTTTTTTGLVGSSAALSPQALFLLPIAALLQISMGFILATIYTTKNIRYPLLGIPKEDDETASDIKMCATFANSGPLPLIFADALFQMKKGILSDVAACVSFYLLIWSPLFWTSGRIILGSYNDKNTSSDVTTGTTPSQYRIIQFKKRMGLIFSPPVVGSILGLMVGSQSTLRNLFFQSSGLLHPLFSAAKSFGHAYLPAALLVLAGSLVGSKANNNNNNNNNNVVNPTATNFSNTSRSPSSKIHPKTIITLLCSRFILAPMVAFASMRLLSLFHVLPTSNPRSLAIVTYVILCEGCMPPAQNSVVMLQLDGKRDRAAKMAKLLTVLYTLATIPITLLLSVCLGISGILNYS